ncbi:hypothetical protein DsansV1_C31g0218631 [Dioscorea sansibarensis]
MCCHISPFLFLVISLNLKKKLIITKGDESCLHSVSPFCLSLSLSLSLSCLHLHFFIFPISLLNALGLRVLPPLHLLILSLSHLHFHLLPLSLLNALVPVNCVSHRRPLLLFEERRGRVPTQ